MEFHSDSSIQRILKNGLFVGARFGVYALPAFFFIPFLFREYGSGSYGLIALAGFLTQYVGLVSSCVSNAITRFLNIALNQGDWKQANEIFSTALVANAGSILVQTPLFALGIWKLEWLIDFPPEIATDFRILVACNVAVFFLSMMTGVIGTPIRAANRLDLNSSWDMIRLSLRLVLLYSLIKFFGAKLWFIGAVDLSLAIVDGMVIFVFYRRLAKQLVFKWAHVTRKWIRPVLNMAGWSMVTALGGCLYVKTDIWMINKFVSKEMAGVYAALLVWPNFLKQVSNQLASLLEPVYLIDYAKGNNDRVARVSLSSAKMLGCFVAVFAGALCVVAKPLLGLWLGAGAEQYVVLFRIMIVYLTYVIGETVLWQIYVTLNKVHFTGLVSLGIGVLNIVVSLTLIRLGYGAVGVAIGTVLSMVIGSSIAIPFGVCHEFGVPSGIVWWNYICATLCMAVSALAAICAMKVSAASYIGAGAVFCGILLVGGLLVSLVVFSKEEKALFHRLITHYMGIISKKSRTRSGVE